MPIQLDGSIVSWQARDITGKSNLKYISPPKDSVLKRTFYGIDFVQKGSTVIIVESIFDAWRLGKGVGIACFGTSWTEAQVWRIVQKHLIELLLCLMTKKKHKYKSINFLLDYLCSI